MPRKMSIILHESDSFFRYGIIEYLKTFFPYIHVVRTPVNLSELKSAVCNVEFDIVMTDILHNKLLLTNYNSVMDFFQHINHEKKIILMGGLLHHSINNPKILNAIKINKKITFKQLGTIFDKLSMGYGNNVQGVAFNASPLQLSHREIMVMSSLIRGKSTHEISREYNLSPATISAHKRNAMRKLGIKNISSFFFCS
ncbi:DNA-binding response regulator [Salmonella enterica]|nr:DNA-binding response regulator [Salmonella enterica]